MPLSKSIRVLIFGAGSIGTYLGCSLYDSGVSVGFIEREEIAADLKERGMWLKLRERAITIPDPSVFISIQEALRAGPYDFGIFAVKSFDTRPALMDISRVKEVLPPLLCLQNGVENENILAAELGSEKVIAGTVTSSILRCSAGNVVLERKRGMGITSNHSISLDLFRLMNRAGLNARLYEHPLDMKWSKLITNLLANATSAILDMTPEQVFSNKDLFRIESLQINEALDVMQAQSIHTVDLPATPVRLLALAFRHFPSWLSQPFMIRSLGKGRGGKMPSLHMDLISGRGQSEVEELNGAIVRYGRRYGIPTPTNQVLYQTLMQLVNKEIPWDTFKHQPDRLVESLAV